MKALPLHSHTDPRANAKVTRRRALQRRSARDDLHAAREINNWHVLSVLPRQRSLRLSSITVSSGLYHNYPSVCDKSTISQTSMSQHSGSGLKDAQPVLQEDMGIRKDGSHDLQTERYNPTCLRTT